MTHLLLCAVLAAALAADGAGGGQADAVDQLLGQLQYTVGTGGHAKPGEWVTLRIRGEGQASYLRFGALADEKLPDGRVGHWYELALGPKPNTALLAAKYLSTGAPGERRTIQETVVRFAGGPAEILNPSKVREIRQREAPGPNFAAAVQRGRERKTVPAGAFDCERVEMGPVTVWVSKDAPVFHIVAGELSGMVFELYDTGDHVADWVGEPVLKMSLGDGGITMEHLDAGGRP